MGQTRYYNLSYFDFGDQLDSTLSIEKETSRFVVIDKQLYGLYNIFGNGVISGWQVKEVTNKLDTNAVSNISVSVSEGLGIIDYYASQTDSPILLNNIPSNSILNIYASLSGSTALDRNIAFSYSIFDISSNSFIKIAQVGTGNDSITFIDNNVRDLIGFEQAIQDAIDAHKHRGTPSKIDLQTETRNQLSGARIEGIDTSKIVSGRFDLERIPVLDHNDLDNTGLLTHADLDSFVKTLSQSNKELLGEIASVNLMKAIVFWKYKDENVDKYFINELSLIPGISPDSFIDFNSSTANINLVDHCISGIPAKTGIFTSVLWNDNYTFSTNISNQNIVIQDDIVTLDRSSESVDVIDNFSGGINSFVPETRLISNDAKASIIFEDGNRIGQLGGGGTLQYYYRKNFAEAEWKNWDGIYDEIVIKVKTTEQIHDPVYMYLVNGSNITTAGQYGTIEDKNIAGTKKPTSNWTILEKDEYYSELQEKSFSITGLSLTQVSQIVIFTSDDFTFDIDDIYVRRTNMYADNGYINFRYTTEAQVFFHSIFYEIDVPEGTSASLRVKVANSEDSLSRSSFSVSLKSGDIFAIEGRSSEIEIVMASDTNRLYTPTIRSLELRLQTTADFTGFVIDTESEWSQGTLSNISISDSTEETDKSTLGISSPINVNGKYFAKSGSISEISDNNIGVYGFSGSELPISPNQAREWTSKSNVGFSTVSSVIRNFDKSFLISDMGNNRVMEIDKEGKLIKGFGSSYAIDTVLYPLSAVYNAEQKRLTIVFTKNAVVADIEKITLNTGSFSFSLTTDDTLINNNKSGGKILEILLSDNTDIKLLNVESDLFVNFESGAFSEDINVNAGMMTPGNSIYSILRGLQCFVGDFTYIDNIKHPVCVKELTSGNWIIGNSSVLYNWPSTTLAEDTDVPDIIEINPDDIDNSGSLLQSTNIKFSDFSLGGIYEYSSNKLLVAGLVSSTASLTVSTTGQDLIDLNGGEDAIGDDIRFRAAAIDALMEYAGVVVVLDKETNRTQVFYNSPDFLYPSEIDAFDDGTYIISESSFYDISGRLSRLDVYGNVIWNYGSGTMAVINDVRVLKDENLMVSV